MKTLSYGTCLCIAILFSCKTAYVPNTVNVPLFNDAGQLRLSGDANGNIQFAASPGRGFGVMANAMFRKDGENSDPVRGSGSFFEAGIGGFSSDRGLLRYEAYIGGGVGKTKTVDNGKTFEANGARFFFQPSIGVHHSIFEVAFTPRLVAGKYQKPTTTYTTADLTSNNLLDLDKPTWVFFEPALTGRIGYKWMKLQLQLGRSIKLTNKPIAFKEDFSSVGLIFDFGRHY
jgi:hypothetical protein